MTVDEINGFKKQVNELEQNRSETLDADLKNPTLQVDLPSVSKKVMSNAETSDLIYKRNKLKGPLCLKLLTQRSC